MMDDWGDPWADDSETKANTTVPSTAGAGSKAITVLDGFADDAQWGDNCLGELHDLDEDERVGKQHAEVEGSLGNDSLGQKAPELDERLDDDVSTNTATATPEANGQNHERNYKEVMVSTLDKFGAALPNAIIAGATLNDKEPHRRGNTETIAAHSSSSFASIQVTAQENHLSIMSTDPTASQDRHVDLSEDEESARPSTSQSEASRLGTDDSPRTSYEEEIIKVINMDDRKEHDKTYGMHPSISEATIRDVKNHGNQPLKDDSEDILEKGKEERLETKGPDLEASSHKPRRPGPDLALISEIFHQESSETLSYPQPDDDSITSTSARKAWYRITRPQTLREFNSGVEFDHYLRVTWKGSAIQDSVHETVKRWADEKRHRVGTFFGKRTTAGFGWHEQTKANNVPPNSWEEEKPSEDVREDLEMTPGRHKSNTSTKPLPMTFTGTDPQFDWSTSYMTEFKQSSPQINRGSHFSRQSFPHWHSESSKVGDASVYAADPNGNTLKDNDGLVKQCVPSSANWTALDVAIGENRGRHDSVTATPRPATPQAVEKAEDEDEEWGEMVSSPSPPQPSIPQTPPHSDAIPSFSVPTVKLISRSESPKEDTVPFKSVVKPMLRNASDDHSRPKPMKLRVALGPEGTFSLTRSPPPPSVAEMRVEGSQPLVNGPKAIETLFQDPWSGADFSVFDAPHPSSVPKSLCLSRAIVQQGRVEIDETVAGIIENLPDLLYMLK